MRRYPLLVVPLVAWLAVACDQTPAPEQSGPAGLYDFVPAASPFVFANRKPYPREVYARQVQLAADMLPGYRSLIATAGEEDPNLAPEQQALFDDMRAVVDALLAELAEHMTPDGLESLGLSPDLGWIAYGDGLAPVMRTEITDGAKVLAFLRRIEARSGRSFTWRRFGDAEYLRFGGDGVAIVVGVRPRQLVLALVPEHDFEAWVPRLFGDTPDPKPLTRAGFAQRFDGYDFPGYSDGYVDHGTVLRLLSAPKGDVGNATLASFGGEMPAPSAACGALLTKLVGTIPRTVFGTDELSTERMRISAVVETGPAIAGRLQELTVPVPGVGRDSDAMYAFGAAMQLTRLRILLKDAIRYLLAEGGNCEWADKAALQAALPQLDAALSPLTAMFKGIYVEAIDFDIDPNTGQPTDLHVRALARLDDPRGLFAMLGMFAPGLASLEVPQDGTPVEVPRASLPPGTPRVHVAASDEVLTVASGDDGEALARQLLNEAPVDGEPLLSFSYNFKRVARALETGLDEMVARATPQTGDADLENARQYMKQMTAMLEHYGVINSRVLATARGIAVEQTVNWD